MESFKSLINDGSWGDVFKVQDVEKAYQTFLALFMFLRHVSTDYYKIWKLIRNT